MTSFDSSNPPSSSYWRSPTAPGEMISTSLCQASRLGSADFELLHPNNRRDKAAHATIFFILTSLTTTARRPLTLLFLPALYGIILQSGLTESSLRSQNNHPSIGGPVTRRTPCPCMSTSASNVPRTFERIEKASALKDGRCPECGGDAHRLIGAPALQFKGSGWYVNDYGKGNGNGSHPTAKETEDGEVCSRIHDRLQAMKNSTEKKTDVKVA